MQSIIYRLIPLVALLSSCDESAPKDEEKKQRVIQRFDKDSDGQLNEEERKAAREARIKRNNNADGEQPNQVKRQRLIKRFDQDGDGVLNDKERAEARKFIEGRK